MLLVSADGACEEGGKPTAPSFGKFPACGASQGLCPLDSMCFSAEMSLEALGLPGRGSQGNLVNPRVA